MGWLVPTHIHTHGYPYPCLSLCPGTQECQQLPRSTLLQMMLRAKAAISPLKAIIKVETPLPLSHPPVSNPQPLSIVAATRRASKATAPQPKAHPLANIKEDVEPVPIHTNDVMAIDVAPLHPSRTPRVSTILPPPLHPTSSRTRFNEQISQSVPPPISMSKPMLAKKMTIMSSRSGELCPTSPMKQSYLRSRIITTLRWLPH